MNNDQKLITIVLPVYNEVDSLGPLIAEILQTSSNQSINVTEILLVDDGSTDGSWQEIERLASIHSNEVSGIRLRRNFGKSIALDVGCRRATGDFVFFMDADGQDDPGEMHKFLEAIEGGADCVVGWKIARKDPWHKTVPSKVFNLTTAKFTGINLHDFNCGYKCCRREVIDGLNLYGELHRFIPVLVDDLGFKVSEVSVNHRRRKAGKSKYGAERFLRGAVDLATILFLTRYSNRPAHVIGGLGIVSGVVGLGVLLWMLALKLIGDETIGNRPLLTFGVMMTLASIQLVSVGLLAELINRQQASTQNNDQLIKHTTDDADSLTRDKTNSAPPG